MNNQAFGYHLKLSNCVSLTESSHITSFLHLQYMIRNMDIFIQKRFDFSNSYINLNRSLSFTNFITILIYVTN